MGIAHEVPELVYLPKKVPDYVLKKEKDGYILSLKNLNVRFSVSDGRISFFSSGGKEIVGEEASLIESSSVQGEKTYVSTQTFHSPFDESLRVRTVSGWLFECAWFNQKTDPG
jgi:alpha-D-xyloside xylohydrolase